MFFNDLAMNSNGMQEHIYICVEFCAYIIITVPTQFNQTSNSFNMN